MQIESKSHSYQATGIKCKLCWVMHQHFILLSCSPPNEKGIKEDVVPLFMVQLPSLFYPQSQQEDESHHPCGCRGVEQVKWVCDRLYYCLGDGSSVFHSRGDTDLLPTDQPVGACTALHLYMHQPFEARVVGCT